MRRESFLLRREFSCVRKESCIARRESLHECENRSGASMGAKHGFDMIAAHYSEEAAGWWRDGLRP